jgi:hypothetical protein
VSVPAASRATSARSFSGCAMRTRRCGWSARSCEKRGSSRQGGRRAVSEVFSLIAAEKNNFPVAVMCRVLHVSRTGLQNWERRAPSDSALSDAWLTEKITQIHTESRGVYGARGGFGRVSGAPGVRQQDVGKLEFVCARTTFLGGSRRVCCAASF